jgi:hypothetical protein
MSRWQRPVPTGDGSPPPFHPSADVVQPDLAVLLFPVSRYSTSASWTLCARERGLSARSSPGSAPTTARRLSPSGATSSGCPADSNPYFGTGRQPYPRTMRRAFPRRTIGAYDEDGSHVIGRSLRRRSAIALSSSGDKRSTKARRALAARGESIRLVPSWQNSPFDAWLAEQRDKEGRLPESMMLINTMRIEPCRLHRRSRYPAAHRRDPSAGASRGRRVDGNPAKHRRRRRTDG